MSCCRSARTLPQSRPVNEPAICVNCHASIRNQVKAALDHRTRLETRTGTHRVTLEVVCTCGYRNLVPMIFSKT